MNFRLILFAYLFLQTIKALKQQETDFIIEFVRKFKTNSYFMYLPWNKSEKLLLIKIFNKQNLKTAFIKKSQIVANIKTDTLTVTTKLTNVINMFVAKVAHKEIEIFKIHSDSQTLETIGSWNGTNLMLKNKIEDFFHLNAGVEIENDEVSQIDFEVFINDEHNKRFFALQQFNYALFQILTQIHHFTYSLELIKPSKNEIESKTLMTTLREKKIEIIATGGLLHLSENNKIQFLFPFYRHRNCYFFRPKQASTIEFLKPFEINTWLATIIVSLLITLGIRIALKSERFEHGATWISALLFVVASLCQQSSEPLPNAFTCRLIILIVYLMSNLLYNYYSSNIVALLLNPIQNVDKTVEGLHESGYVLGIDNNQLLYETPAIIENSSKFYPPQIGIEMVRDELFAYQTDTWTAYHYIDNAFRQNEICDLAEIEYVPSHLGGLQVLREQFQFYQLFQISLLRLNQAGMIQRLQMIWEAKKPLCYSNPDLISLGMEQAEIALLCFGIGVGLALIILTTEIGMHKIKNKSFT